MRSYMQFCPAAHALDLVGERWSLLIVRELLTGPKRYTDLQGGLPGIGPNVLADRLHSLERSGLVRKRRLPPPAASTVYDLTDLGMGLRPVLLELFLWGLQLLGTPGRGETVKASYWLPALQAAARPSALPADVDDVYEFRVGEERITVAAKTGMIDVRPGQAESPDVVLQTDALTFVKLGRGLLSPAEAIHSGQLTVDGDAAAAQRCAAAFAVTGL